MPMVVCDHIHVFAHNLYHHHRFLEVGLVLVASVIHDLKLVFQEFEASGFLDQELVFSLNNMWVRIIFQCTRRVQKVKIQRS